MADRQVSFAAGELAPELYGRTDVDRYGAGARTVRNFVVTPHGTLRYRTGLQMIKSLSMNTASTECCLIPFVYDEGDALLICLTAGTLQVVKADSGDVRFTVTFQDGFAAPWSSDLHRIRWQQVGNKVYIVDGSTTIQVLTRNSDTDWELAEFDVSDLAPVDYRTLDDSLKPRVRIDALKSVPFELGDSDAGWDWMVSHVIETTDGTVRETIGTKINNAQMYMEDVSGTVLLSHFWHQKYNEAREDLGWTAEDPPFAEGGSYSGADSVWIGFTDEPFGVLRGITGSITTWRDALFYKLTEDSATYDDTYGLLGNDQENATDWPLWGGVPRLSVSPSHPIDIWTPYAEGDSASQPGEFWSGNDGGTVVFERKPTWAGTVLETRIYRGKDGQYGYVGSTKSNIFVDRGVAPDYSRPPRRDSTPLSESLKLIDPPTSLFSKITMRSYNRRPSAVASFEGRLAFAALVGSESAQDRLNKVLLSGVDVFDDFQINEFSVDTDAVDVEFVAPRIVDIMETQGGLLVITIDNVFLVAGSGQAEVITGSAIPRKRTISHQGGSRETPAQYADDTVFYTRRTGSGPVALRISDAGFQSIDVGLLSKHLFDGYTIKSWAWARTPESTLWVVRSDGALLSLTYIPEQQMWAWTQHHMPDKSTDPNDQAEALAVASIPEGTEDSVYVAVYRKHTGTYGATGDIYLERLGHQNLPQISYAETMDDGSVEVREVPDVRYAVHLDRCKTYNGLNETDVQLALTATAVTKFWHIDGNGDFTDDTTDANDAGAADLDLFQVGIGPEGLAVGHNRKFGKIQFDNAGGTAGVKTAGDFTSSWQYWNGSAWTDLGNVVDGTSDFTAGPSDGQTVTFDIPEDWEPSQVGTGDYLYTVRFDYQDGYDITPVYDQVFIVPTGIVGDVIVATFDDFENETGSYVQIDNGIELPIRLLLGTETSANVYEATVVQVPGDTSLNENELPAIPSSFIGADLQSFWKLATSVDGLNYIDGATVKALADGDVIEDLTVAGGGVDLADYLPMGGFAICTVGIPYNGDFESLAVAQQKGRQKIVERAGVDVVAGRGGYVGNTLDNLSPDIYERDQSGGFRVLLLERREIEVNIEDDFDTEGFVAFRHSDPLPCTLLAISRVVRFGGE